MGTRRPMREATNASRPLASTRNGRLHLLHRLARMNREPDALAPGRPPPGPRLPRERRALLGRVVEEDAVEVGPGDVVGVVVPVRARGGSSGSPDGRSISSMNTAPFFRWKPAASSRWRTPSRSKSGTLAGSSDSPTWKRGKRSRSKQTTLSPARARTRATVEPAGPPPTTATSHRGAIGHFASELAASRRPRRDGRRAGPGGEHCGPAAGRAPGTTRSACAVGHGRGSGSAGPRRVDRSDGDRDEPVARADGADQRFRLQDESLLPQGTVAQEGPGIDPEAALAVARAATAGARRRARSAARIATRRRVGIGSPPPGRTGRPRTSASGASRWAAQKARHSPPDRAGRPRRAWPRRPPPRRSAAPNPVRRAAPLPPRRAMAEDLRPRRPASRRPALPSVEPSSTTITGQCARDGLDDTRPTWPPRRRPAPRPRRSAITRPPPAAHATVDRGPEHQGDVGPTPRAGRGPARRSRRRPRIARRVPCEPKIRADRLRKIRQRGHRRTPPRRAPRRPPRGARRGPRARPTRGVSAVRRARPAGKGAGPTRSSSQASCARAARPGEVAASTRRPRAPRPREPRRTRPGSRRPGAGNPWAGARRFPQAAPASSA